jgi:hypothetical protein
MALICRQAITSCGWWVGSVEHAQFVKEPRGHLVMSEPPIAGAQIGTTPILWHYPPGCVGSLVLVAAGGLFVSGADKLLARRTTGTLG